MSFYYLHSETKDLIWKKFEPESDSHFVVCVWPFDVTNRAHAWTLCLEGLSLGAKIDRVRELAAKWALTPADALDYMAAFTPTPEKKAQLEVFMANVHGLTDEEFWAFVTKEADTRMGKIAKGAP